MTKVCAANSFVIANSIDIRRGSMNSDLNANLRHISPSLPVRLHVVFGFRVFAFCLLSTTEHRILGTNSTVVVVRPARLFSCKSMTTSWTSCRHLATTHLPCPKFHCCCRSRSQPGYAHDCRSLQPQLHASPEPCVLYPLPAVYVCMQ